MTTVGLHVMIHRHSHSHLYAMQIMKGSMSARAAVRLVLPQQLQHPHPVAEPALTNALTVHGHQ